MCTRNNEKCVYSLCSFPLDHAAHELAMLYHTIFRSLAQVRLFVCVDRDRDQYHLCFVDATLSLLLFLCVRAYVCSMHVSMCVTVGNASIGSLKQ